MRAPRNFRDRLLWFGLLTAFWIFLGLIFAIQMVFSSGESWSRALRFAFRDWYPWILLSPLVLWVGKRFPLEAGHWRLSIPIHVVACAAAVVSAEMLSGLIEPRPGGPPPGRLHEMAEHRRMEGQGPPGTNFHRLGFRPGGPPPMGGPRGPGGPGFRGFLMRVNSKIPIYCFVLSMGHALTYFRRSQERERKALELEARLAEAKLQALQMQLHPHFLFNTLHAISTLVHKDPAAADEMIANLSELLRMSLEDSDQPEIPLRKELDYVDRYLEIQQVRFGDRLHIEKQIDDGVLAAQVPAMILQPLVENAIRHGIEPRAAEGIISIAASRLANALALTVEDTGGGTKTATGKPGREGIGLSNTRARLRGLYGDDYRLQLNNGPRGGFVAHLEIPYHEEPLVGQGNKQSDEDTNSDRG